MLILRKFLTAFLILSCPALALAQQDCFDAINVCSSSYSQSSSFSGTGSVNELPPNSSCLGNGETNSVWYTFTAAASGNLNFQLSPLNLNDDYDFALYNMTNDSCSGITAGINQPVSCNYSASAGATGLSSAGSGNQNGSSGSNQNASLPAQAGETFALLISNFTSSQTGYELSFSGSASIVDNSAGVIDSVSLEGECNPNTVRVYLSNRISCSTITGNASDFTITGPSGVTITSANAVACSGGFTNRIRLNFSGNLPVVGTYTLTINVGSDGNTLVDGCGNEMAAGTSIQFQVANIGPTVSITNVVSSDCAVNNGSATAVVTGGTAPYTFNWNSSPSQNTATANNLGPGLYRVTVKDANGCRIRKQVTIGNNNPLNVSNVSVVSVSCNGATDGSAQIIPVGSAPFIIEWNTNPPQTGQNANNLSGGNVNVLVTDNTGCVEDVTISIPQPTTINVPITVANPDCGATNGTATVNASGGNGGFTYLWNTNPPQTTATAIDLPAGVYDVAVTDMSGCSRNTSVILVNNFAPNATIQNRIPDCGQGIGSATAVATSGLAPFSYSWNTIPPQNTATATGLLEGSYFATITDGNGCIQIVNVKIDSVPPPSLSLTLTQPNCGQADGEAIASVTNGTLPLSYLWSSSPNTTATETGLVEGAYTITVTDSVGCTASESFTLLQLLPESDATFTDVCEGIQTDFTSQTTSGATSWYWDFGDGNSSTLENPTHTYSASGQYDVTVYFLGGCAEDTVTQTVTVFVPPTAEFVVAPEIPTTRNYVAFTYTGIGGSTFSWDFSDTETSSEENPTHQFGIEGIYTIYMTTVDQNGCVDSSSQTIEVLLQPVLYLPNAFIPNGTYENRTWKGYGLGVVSAELSVFNRWGTMVYFSASSRDILFNGWDGTFKGNQAPQGAYAYKLKASFYNNTSFEKLGTVTLIR
jgi:gliding motility-associated-like protein